MLFNDIKIVIIKFFVYIYIYIYIYKLVIGLKK